ncbi:Histone-lysine N-methyltransferase ASHH2 [Sesamum alatum]|uniref:Histone-lysine N-methyltransferase ASHH2 n=1 Tax=Sesamum alatum TaxID=300844 RepID=A0AAE1YG11_9LAMI|nr:Histone-lysine N-methyltransferase ASHH2 [Sesamum alatum]
MFTETSFGENASEIKEESSVVDLDLVTGKLSVCPTPYESSCVGAGGSSMSMVNSDVSGADLLLSGFDSISVSDRFEPRDNTTDGIKADALVYIGEADPSGQRPDEAKYISKFDFSNLASIAEPSTRRDGEAEVLVGIDKSCKTNHPLIVYTSLPRSACNTKSSQNNESQKPSKRKGRRIAIKNSVLDLSSLRILRRSRSSFSKPARSSVWGCLGNILPISEGNNELDLNLGEEKKLRKVGGGKGKRNATKDQIGRTSTRKRCTTTGHISLKIKIGNKSCSLGDAAENLRASGNDIPLIFDTMENKLGEEMSGDMVSPCEKNLENVTSPAASALSTHLDDSGALCDPSLNTSSDFHQIISHEDSVNLGASIENQCSDVGTSPDSEVINSVPDGSFCEKDLPDIHDSPITSKEYVSPSDVSSLILSREKSKKGKKDKLLLVGNCTLQRKQTGAQTMYTAKLSVPLGDSSSLCLPRSKCKKGKKKDKLHEVGDLSVYGKLTGADTTNNAEVPADHGEATKVGDASMMTTVKPYSDGAETNACSGLVAASVSSNSLLHDKLVPCKNRRKLPKCSRAKGVHKARSRILDLPGDRNKSSKRKGQKNNVGGKHQATEEVDASGALSGVESLLAAGNQESSDLGETAALSKDISAPRTDLQFSSGGVREQYTPPRNAWVLCDECQKWRRIPATLADQIEETNCGWTCKDNTDRDFADCSIPQEKSNSEINEELEISDASCEEDACGTFLKSKQYRSKVAQQASWSLIKTNLFLHRSRKRQTIDEVMVCHCKPPSDGRMGCGAKCLNRMLNIECVQGTCPCGELCSNQQFQTRKYAKLKWFRCGKKGYGLQALEDISQGQFLIEYVGEVLDVHAYEARQREYALNGHKHFYFMTLNGSEVIDACAKGNLGRFINHSCDPNCRTEKWMVNGEVCIGLFSLRDIKKGEEVTFDYNYVRVFGAAAKKCVCGSPNCRGYIGGDPLNSEVVVQDDSDDDYLEPVMTCGDRDMNDDWNDIMSNSLNDGQHESASKPPANKYNMKKRINTVGESISDSHTSEPSTQKVEGVKTVQVEKSIVQDRSEVENSAANDSATDAFERLDINKITGQSLNGSVSATSKVESEGLWSRMHSSSQLMDISFQSDGVENKAMSSTQSPIKSLSDMVESKRKLKYAAVRRRHEPPKSSSLAKTNSSSSSIKKGKHGSDVVNDKETIDVDTSNAALEKSKKLPELSLNNRFEAVEEKLNELLDPEGGISKRKDASRGYLKLLFLTAASGNNGHGEAIQSNRDLSMILDALLKTKSRTVLVDIINKNGLQMLHNIMKRYRKEFIKTPILRKLLKVLEYLAAREILTSEHITGGPPCPGVESFRDSILILTEHADKQVHQIARNFRDRWIPRHLRKNCCMERDDGKIEFHHQHISYGGLSVSYNHLCDRGAKPSEQINTPEMQSAAASGTVETSTPDLPSALGTSCGTNGTKTRKRKSRWDNPVEEYPHSRSRINVAGDEKLDTDEDVPPGFSSPCNGGHRVQSDATSTTINHLERETCIKQHPVDIISGDSQLRFVARMPLSYGVSYSVMQQFGVRKAETSDCWTVAPGVPFHPFPPLPPYPHGKEELPTSAAGCASLGETAEKIQQNNDTRVTYHTGQIHPGICSIDPPEQNVSVANGLPDFQQDGSCSLGRKYFRQQKWNHAKLPPPWVRMRNGWGHAGNNTRNVPPGLGLGNGPNEFRNSYNSENVNWRGVP